MGVCEVGVCVHGCMCGCGCEVRVCECEVWVYGVGVRCGDVKHVYLCVCAYVVCVHTCMHVLSSMLVQLYTQ